MFLTDSIYCIQIHNHNSYIIIDNKIVLIDTIPSYQQVWYQQITKLLLDHQIDYFIISHSYQTSAILPLCQKYPQMKLLTTPKIKRTLNLTNISNPIITMNENDFIDLGHDTLSFRMVDEMIVTYLVQAKILFSSIIFSTVNITQKWNDNARYYYTHHLSGYNQSLQKIIHDIKLLELLMICPAHGTIIHDNILQCIRYYELWTKCVPEENGVLIILDSSNILIDRACHYLQKKLINQGDLAFVFDISKDDMKFAVSQTLKYDRLIIDANMFYADYFIQQLQQIHLENRVIGVIGMSQVQLSDLQNSISLLNNILKIDAIIIDENYQLIIEKSVKTILEAGCEDGICV